MKNPLKSRPRAGLVAAIQRFRMRRAWRKNAKRSVGEVFSNVYAKAEWGGQRGEFHSGPGSDDSSTESYSAAVSDFVQHEGVGQIVDLGCGDFRVGGRLLSAFGNSTRYVGVDVVEELIARNQQEFGSDLVSFQCLDVATGPLPEGDLCLVRQVFQHLSNDQILRILPRLDKYPLVLITEHYPAPAQSTVPNLDKIHGGDTRLQWGSAVCLDLEPFGVHGLEIFHDHALTPTEGYGQTIKTWLIRNGERTATRLAT
jgi:SAM-dependent methyltransferase